MSGGGARRLRLWLRISTLYVIRMDAETQAAAYDQVQKEQGNGKWPWRERKMSASDWILKKPATGNCIMKRRSRVSRNLQNTAMLFVTGLRGFTAVPSRNDNIFPKAISASRCENACNSILIRTVLRERMWQCAWMVNRLQHSADVMEYDLLCRISYLKSTRQISKLRKCKTTATVDSNVRVNNVVINEL